MTQVQDHKECQVMPEWVAKSFRGGGQPAGGRTRLQASVMCSLFHQISPADHKFQGKSITFGMALAEHKPMWAMAEHGTSCKCTIPMKHVPLVFNCTQISAALRERERERLQYQSSNSHHQLYITSENPESKIC